MLFFFELVVVEFLDQLCEHVGLLFETFLPSMTVAVKFKSCLKNCLSVLCVLILQNLLRVFITVNLFNSLLLNGDFYSVSTAFFVSRKFRHRTDRVREILCWEDTALGLLNRHSILLIMLDDCLLKLLLIVGRFLLLFRLFIDLLMADCFWLLTLINLHFDFLLDRLVSRCWKLDGFQLNRLALKLRTTIQLSFVLPLDNLTIN